MDGKWVTSLQRSKLGSGRFSEFISTCANTFESHKLLTRLTPTQVEIVPHQPGCWQTFDQLLLIAPGLLLQGLNMDMLRL